MSVQISLGKGHTPPDDLLRHSATVLAAARNGQEDILYVCRLPNQAFPGTLLGYLNLVPAAMQIVPASLFPRNPQFLLPHANPRSLVVKFRTSPDKPWSAVDTQAGAEIPGAGRFTFKVCESGYPTGLHIAAESDEDYSRCVTAFRSMPHSGGALF